MIAIAGKKISKVQIVTLEEFAAIAYQGATPGDVVLVNDVVSGSEILWPLEYAPNDDPDNPWKNIDDAYTSHLNSSWTIVGLDAGLGPVGTGWARANVDFPVPRPGIYRASPQVWGYYGAGGGTTIYVGVNLSSSVGPVSTDTTNEAYASRGAGSGAFVEFTGSAAGRQTPKDLTVPAGGTIYTWVRDPVAGSSVTFHSRKLLVKPVRTG